MCQSIGYDCKVVESPALAIRIWELPYWQTSSVTKALLDSYTVYYRVLVDRNNIIDVSFEHIENRD
jgi:hypothetical protein